LIHFVTDPYAVPEFLRSPYSLTTAYARVATLAHHVVDRDGKNMDSEPAANNLFTFPVDNRFRAAGYFP
jgi:hypothetical protein